MEKLIISNRNTSFKKVDSTCHHRRPESSEINAEKTNRIDSRHAHETAVKKVVLRREEPEANQPLGIEAHAVVVVRTAMDRQNE